MQALPLPLSYAAIGIVSILGNESLSLRVGAIGILHDMSTLRPHRQPSRHRRDAGYRRHG